MKKKLLYVSPILSRSGYGDHAREFAEFLLSQKKYYDIHIIATPWGDNPQTGLKCNFKLNEELSKLFVDKQSVHDFYDIYVQLGLPPEFKRLGTFNVGITAGVETSKVNAPFIQGCNKMDLVIVPSEFTKNTFENSIHQIKGEKLNLTTEIKVIPEYSVESFYESTDFKESVTTRQLDKIQEDFCFLFVGQWTTSKNDDGGRKNISSLIKTFTMAFASSNNKPALILKTNGTRYSTPDYYETQKKINDITDEYDDSLKPNIYLLHGEISSTDLPSLYSHPKVKAFVTHARGEGFGRPLLEATLCGCPVLAPNHSGYLDFLNDKQSVLLKYKEKKVGVTNELFHADSVWADVDESYSAKCMIDVYENYNVYKKNADDLKSENIIKFSKTSVFELYKDILITRFKKIPSEVDIELPDIY